MNLIIKYILTMIFYMVISIPFYLTIRYIILNPKKQKRNWYHEIGLFLFVLFIIGLASLTIIPKIEFGINGVHIVKNGVHKTNLIPFKVLVETYNEFFVHKNIDYFIINFLGNIIMFLPIGFFTSLLWELSNKKIIAIGFCSSLFIESCQLFLTRGTDIDDVILNTLGTYFGLLIYKFLYKKLNRFLIKFREQNKKVR